MEKIIAAVIMIMIVVGLIVLVIMPQQKSMTTMGKNANAQTDTLADTLSNNNVVTGSQIIEELDKVVAKTGEYPATTISITFPGASSETDAAKAKTKIQTNSYYNNAFTRTTTMNGNNIATITYVSAVK